MAVSFISSDRARMRLPLPKKAIKSASKRKSKSSDGKETENLKTKRKRSSSAKTNAKKSLKTNAPKNRSVSNEKVGFSKPNAKNDVIDLLDESNDDLSSRIDLNVPACKRALRRPTETPVTQNETTENHDDDDSEFEFEG